MEKLKQLKGFHKSKEQMQKHLSLLAQGKSPLTFFSCPQKTLKQARKIKQKFVGRTLSDKQKHFAEGFFQVEEILKTCESTSPLAERFAFEVARHTMFFGDFCEYFTKISGIGVQELEQAIRLKKCQYFLMLAFCSLQEEVDMTAVANILGKLDLNKIHHGVGQEQASVFGKGLVAFTNSFGQIQLCFEGKPLLAQEERFPQDNGVKFETFSPFLQGKRLVASRLSDSVARLDYTCGVLSQQLTVFPKNDAIVFDLLTANNGKKTFSGSVDFFLDLSYGFENQYPKTNVHTFECEGATVVSCFDKFVVFVGGKVDAKQQSVVKVQCSFPQKISSGAEGSVRFAIAVFHDIEEAKKFCANATTLCFLEGDFFKYTGTRQQTYSQMNSLFQNTYQEIPPTQRMSKKDYVTLASKNAFSSWEGKLLGSCIVDSFGNTVRLDNRPLTTPKFGGERICFKTQNRLIWLNTGPYTEVNDAITYKFAEKEMEITTTIDSKGNYCVSSNVTGQVLAFFDLQKREQLLFDSQSVTVGDMKIFISEKFEVSTRRVSKFAPTAFVEESFGKGDFLCLRTWPTKQVKIAFLSKSTSSNLIVDSRKHVLVKNQLECVESLSIIPTVLSDFKLGASLLHKLLKGEYGSFDGFGRQKQATCDNLTLPLFAFWLMDFVELPKGVLQKASEQLLTYCHGEQLVIKAMCISKALPILPDKVASLTALSQIQRHLVEKGDYREKLLAQLCGVLPLPQDMQFAQFKNSVQKTFFDMPNDFLGAMLLQNVYGFCTNINGFSFAPKFVGALPPLRFVFAGKRFSANFSKGQDRMVLNDKVFFKYAPWQYVREQNNLQIFSGT